MTSTDLKTTAPAGRYPYLADAGRQIDQLARLLAWEHGQRWYMHVDRDPDVLEQLVDGKYVSWSAMGYSLTDRGRTTVLKLAELDAYEEHAERERTAVEVTQRLDAVADEVAAEQTEIRPSEGTLPGVSTTGRHRIVKKSRVAWLRERFTLARVAALSASVGVLVGVGFMWLVTR